MFMDSNKMKQPFFGYLDAKNTKKRILTKLMKHKEKNQKDMIMILEPKFDTK
jgi:hypothetical protein